MSRIAKAEWRRCGKELIQAGKLTGNNLKDFEIYCNNYGVYREAMETVKAKGQVIVSGKNGHLMEHPCIAIANKAQAHMRDWLKMIRNLDVEKPVKQSDPLFDFLKRGKKLQAVK